jgi:hypothetical protein
MQECHLHVQFSGLYVTLNCVILDILLAEGSSVPEAL